MMSRTAKKELIAALRVHSNDNGTETGTVWGAWRKKLGPPCLLCPWPSAGWRRVGGETRAPGQAHLLRVEALAFPYRPVLDWFGDGAGGTQAVQ